MSSVLASEMADFSILMQRNFSSVDTLGSHPAAAPDTFLSFLANAQALEVPILPITLQSAQKAIKIGGTARIEEAQANALTNVASKCIKESEKRERTEAEIFQLLTAELIVLGHERIRAHENVIQLQGICWDVTLDHGVWPVLVFRKSALGDLSDFMESKEERALNIHQRAELGFGIGDAIVDMHSISTPESHVRSCIPTDCNRLDIVHGDLKPENVLIFKEFGSFREPDSKYTAKVIDFGYSTRYADEKHLIRLPISRPWNAPEHTRLNRQWTPEEAKKADIFSAGLLFLWVLFDSTIPEVSSLGDGERAGLIVEASSANRKRSRDKILGTLLKYKNDKALPALARKLLEAEGKLKDVEKSNLEDFFNSVLSNNPDDRDALSLQTPALDRHKIIVPPASEADFKVKFSGFNNEDL